MLSFKNMNLREKIALGHTLIEQGQTEKVEKCIKGALAEGQKIDHLENEHSADTMKMLGDLLMKDDAYTEAERCYRRALEGKEKHVPRSPHVISYKKCLADSLYEQNKLNESQRYYQEVMAGGIVVGWDGMFRETERNLRRIARRLKPKSLSPERDSLQQAKDGGSGPVPPSEQPSAGLRERSRTNEKSRAGSGKASGENEEINHVVDEPLAQNGDALQGAENEGRRDNGRVSDPPLASAVAPPLDLRAQYLESRSPVVTPESTKRDRSSSRQAQDSASTKSLTTEELNTRDETSMYRYQDSQASSSLPVRERRPRVPASSSSLLLTESSGSQQLSSHLNYYFTENHVQRSNYTDKEISKIASLLEHLNPIWSKAPRTYIVLRTINCLDLFDDLIASGFSDYIFPATGKNLIAMSSVKDRSRFLEAQHLVLTKSLDLEKGQHCFFDKEEIIPLEKQRVLGRGGFGQVDEVVSLVSYEKFARKRILRKMKLEHLQLFTNELETIKRLSHKHVVEFVGSYSDTKYLGLLMRPVAEMDLSTYLTRPDISIRLGELRTFFGCLATALHFLHSNKIRHKDIKPQNILINRGNVLLTDFGLSRDFTDAQGSTTVSMVNGLTPKYCAPEVAAQEPRNSSSDVWSLGVVFLEMFVVLKGHTREYLDDYLTEHGSKRPFIRTNRTGMNELTKTLQSSGRRSDNQVIVWVEDMLRDEGRDRPTAKQLMENIISLDSQEGYEGGSFCGICCLPHNEDGMSDFSD